MKNLIRRWLRKPDTTANNPLQTMKAALFTIAGGVADPRQTATMALEQCGCVIPQFIQPALDSQRYYKASDSPALKYQSPAYSYRFFGNRVPYTVRIVNTVTKAHPDAKLIAEKNHYYTVYVDSDGNVSAIVAFGELLPLGPDDFTVTSWHK